jgi:BirA family transcriptional regulator, biotin operon repressor / biotin---[acetyl-CoA-carboxylase] ligase
MPGARFSDVRRFDSIDSTNRFLLDEARAGAPAGVVAVADHQTAGRGRLGRTWEAPPGANLLLSVLLRPVLEPGDRHLTTTAVALAAVEAISAVTSPGAAVPVGIKWPNDLVDAGGRKLAGVLAESDLASAPTNADMAQPVVVGIGINVNWPATDRDLPPELRGRAVSLQMLRGAPVEREDLLAALLVALEPRAADLETTAGRARLAEDLRAGCTTVGTQVRVDLADDSFVGTATGISPEGHLVVEADGVVRTVVAGDVVHLRPRA